MDKRYVGKCRTYFLDILTVNNDSETSKRDMLTNFGTEGNCFSRSIPYFCKEWKANADNPK